jgi:pimeloyl-ACP methyl ester carboxylesterase
MPLHGDLSVPPDASGVVVFAHGSGSSSRSPRNRYVARLLEEGGLATLLFDLLTDEEANDRRNVFDVDVLAQRLSGAISWVREQRDTGALPVGLFGASTGAAAALLSAAQRPDEVAAVVSRGGRPDLAGDRLPDVRAPTLLVVGAEDDVVLALNRHAAARLTCEHELAVVPGATHLFEEPGTLDVAATLARAWFLRHASSGTGLPR